MTNRIKTYWYKASVSYSHAADGKLAPAGRMVTHAGNFVRAEIDGAGQM